MVAIILRRVRLEDQVLTPLRGQISAIILETVRLEVKTFRADGRVIVTNRELQAAVEYYLVGVCDSGATPPSQRATYLMPDPLLRLMSLGRFVVETKLQADVESLFGRNSAPSALP
jgi:hypothetical protein